MRIQVLKHVGFEGPGAVAVWASAHGHALALTELSQGEALPALDAFDALVLMGGPMSVNDEARFAWLKPEKALVREAIAAGKKVLGICLGAQMIASALGAEVKPNAQKEIGWFPVEAVADGAGYPLLAGLPASFEVFHWHGETFSLPPNAVHLWRSEACAHQAFAIGTQVLGLQCHPEVSVESLREMAAGGADELVTGLPFVQAYDRLDQPDKVRALGPVLDRLLQNWAA
jgi:GMP synthase-like glutamine amidotransferase